MYGNNHWKLAEAHMKLAEDYQELKGKYGRNYWKFSLKDQIMSLQGNNHIDIFQATLPPLKILIMVNTSEQ